MYTLLFLAAVTTHYEPLSAAMHGGRAYVTMLDGTLMKVNPREQAANRLFQRPGIAEGGLLSTQKGLYLIGLNTIAKLQDSSITPLWVDPKSGSSNRRYIVSDDGKLVGVRQGSSLRRKFLYISTRKPLSNRAVYADGPIYFSSENNSYYVNSGTSIVRMSPTIAELALPKHLAGANIASIAYLEHKKFAIILTKSGHNFLQLFSDKQNRLIANSNSAALTPDYYAHSRISSSITSRDKYLVVGGLRSISIFSFSSGSLRLIKATQLKEPSISIAGNGLPLAYLFSSKGFAELNLESGALSGWTNW